MESTSTRSTPPKIEDWEEGDWIYARARLNKGYDVLKDLWESTDPEHKEWVKGWEALAVQIIQYEIMHNKLPI